VNWDEVSRHWNKAQPEIKSRWTKLTATDLDSLGANEARLVAAIEERYGILEEDALSQVNEWLEKRSPPAEVKPYRGSVFVALVIAAALAGLTFLRLPWGAGQYVVVGVAFLALMAILFQRRRRLEF
jgi:hypothetical protein